MGLKGVGELFASYPQLPKIFRQCALSNRVASMWLMECNWILIAALKMASGASLGTEFSIPERC